MNELVTIQNGKAITTSLKVAEVFEKEHKDVLKAIREMQCSSEFFAANFFAASFENRGKDYPMLELTRDGFTFLAMGFTGTKAAQFKEDYIQAFNQMERQMQQPFQVPQTYSEALRLAADLSDENQKLLVLREQDKPKVIFADALTVSENSILIGELAKLLKQNGIEIGQNRLFEKLRNDGYLCKTGENYNLPTQYAMELGLFEIKKTTVNNPDGSVRVTRTTKVSGKGQVYFVNKFLKKEALECC